MKKKLSDTYQYKGEVRMRRAVGAGEVVDIPARHLAKLKVSPKK